VIVHCSTFNQMSYYIYFYMDRIRTYILFTNLEELNYSLYSQLITGSLKCKPRKVQMCYFNIFTLPNNQLKSLNTHPNLSIESKNYNLWYLLYQIFILYPSLLFMMSMYSCSFSMRIKFLFKF